MRRYIYTNTGKEREEKLFAPIVTGNACAVTDIFTSIVAGNVCTAVNIFTSIAK
jgi:hypothetical protein